MKGFFGFVSRLAGAIGILFVFLSAAVPATRAWALSVESLPPVGVLRLQRHRSTPTPTPKPSPTRTPTPVPTPAPRTPTPTATPPPHTPTPAATSTPSNIGAEITINAPSNGQTVSGNGLIVTVTLGPDVYWDQLMVDGTSVWSGTGNCTWDSTGRRWRAHSDGSGLRPGRHLSDRYRVSLGYGEKLSRSHARPYSYARPHFDPCVDSETHTSADVYALALDPKPHA